MQRFQNEQEDDYGLDDALPLPEEIFVETFLAKFKLPSFDKYDGMTNPISCLGHKGGICQAPCSDISPVLQNFPSYL